VTAVFGLFGEGDLGEVRQMGARLAHRGPLQVTWSVNSRVHLGSRGRSRATQVSGLPLAFSGFFDNRPELLAMLGIGADQAASITDAELFLALYRRYGEEGLGGIRGQFAVALWDATRQRLLLLCDPLATKLLYVARAGDRWAFATEYKSLLALGDVPARPDRNAIHHLHCTKQPYARGSLLEGVRPLLPGTCMELGGPEPVTRCYRPLQLRISQQPEAAQARGLRDRLLASAELQTRGRPELGLALSSGLDSAVTIGAIRHVAPDLRLHTFTAGFGSDDGGLVAAAEVARHFETIHHEVTLTPHDLPGLLPHVVWHMEDPIGREEMVFWYLISQEAARHVPMLLCGNLSDLLFAGMPRFIVPRAATSLPFLKSALEEFYNCTQSGRLPSSLLGRLLTKAYFHSMPLAPPRVLGVTEEVDLARFDLSHPEPLNKLLIDNLNGQPNPNAAYERLYANGGIDYNSPFYDLDVVDYAFTVPDRMKIQGREQKHILREAAKGLLPEAILRRPKDLLRLARDRRFSDALAAMAREYLAPHQVRERGLFAPGDIVRMTRRPRGGLYPEDQLYRLWTLLLTEIWSGIYLDHRGAAPLTARPPLVQAA
jgi:asparagine synthase (glutamine-hydrolysing)